MHSPLADPLALPLPDPNPEPTALLYERVAQWLDDHAPQAEAWPLALDLQALNLTSATDCVLGQVFARPNQTRPCAHCSPGFHYVLLHLPPDGCSYQRPLTYDCDAVEFFTTHGFVATYDYDSDTLREAWTSLVKERLSAGVPLFPPDPDPTPILTREVRP